MNGIIKKKLSQLINDCINIENNIKNINIINENIKKCNLNKDLIIEFSPNEIEINDFLEKIKIFGNITKKSLNDLNNMIEEKKFIFPKKEFYGWTSAP